MTASLHDDEFTELTDAQIDRVDLVGKAANGHTFLIRKAAEQGDLNPSLVPDDLIRDLISKADAQEGAPVTTAPVEKAELDVTDAPAVDDLIPDAPAGSTASSLPGSPDWEQLDGDTAMNAVAVLGRLKGVLSWLSDREAQEAVTGGDYDADGNSWDLDSMACQIDAMIGALAGFAVGEHMEADALDAVGKAVATAAEPLAVVEGLAPIAKAGRTLSAANESKIRAAVESLTGVLNSLPAAPADDVTKETAVPAAKTLIIDVQPRLVTADGEPVAKGADLAAAMLAGAPALAAADVLGALVNGGRTVDVAKAAGDPQLAVFDADGKLIGTIDPAKLSPIATSPAAADKPADEAPDDDAEQPAEDAPDAAPDAEDAPDAAPDAEDAPDAAPATEATIPGTATVQSPPEQDPNAVTKTAQDTANPLAEQVVSLAKQVSDLAADNEVLKETVRKYGMSPDDRRSPVLNGGQPAATRDGQDGEPADIQKAIAAETDPVKKDALRKQAFFADATQLYANPAEVRSRFTR